MINQHLTPLQELTLCSFCTALIQFHSGLTFEKVNEIFMKKSTIDINFTFENAIFDKRSNHRFSSEEFEEIKAIFKEINVNSDKIRKLRDFAKKHASLKKMYDRAYALLARSTVKRSGTSHTIQNKIQISGRGEDYLTAAIFVNELSENNLTQRYLNAGFCSTESEQVISYDQPLSLDIGLYRLKVNIGEFWGPGKPNNPFPDELLEPFFDDSDSLEIDVVVSARNITVSPAQIKLQLPKTGNSQFVFFELTFSEKGRHFIDVDLLFNGNLLQSRRVEVEVVAEAGDVVPQSAWRIQDGYITWTRSSKLSWSELTTLKEHPRKFTIAVERDIDFNRIGLRFFDNTGNDLGFQESSVTDANLTRYLTGVREVLKDMMAAYTGRIGSTDDVLAKYLWNLADHGKYFYRSLLGRFDELFGDLKIEARSVIQVAPLSRALGVPWEALYDRQIESYEEGATDVQLCPTWRSHEPGNCPSLGTDKEGEILCPHGFWGYRYVIEQLPCRLDPHQPLAKHSLPVLIRNDIPTKLKATVATKDLSQMDAHLESLLHLASKEVFELSKISSRKEFKGWIKSYAKNPVDVMYFYTHSGFDKNDFPYLMVGSDEKIKINDLDSWKMELFGYSPLIVLNACESASYTPESFEGLLEFFYERGAAGMIGTQCAINEKLANKFIIDFFDSFLRQASVGQSLFNAREALLRNEVDGKTRPDPRGLAYSLFASADIKLAQAVIS